MVCVDTSFIISLERREKAALEKIHQLEVAGDLLYTTAVTVAELYRGAYSSRERTAALKEIKGLLDRFVILNLDYDSARIWGHLVQSMRSDSIGDRDLFIASISLSNNQALVTKNKRHFERVAGLRVEDW